ncbi:golgin subfamily A member 6-like protein 22 isoform X2 [Tiliqua scincoides]|uniref:golgin subfamily A member 6-like protein 22 isoform X2 n=1 Tax=Tiliqua scincoides TaxID=71010 RepID=UPI003462A61F
MRNMDVALGGGNNLRQRGPGNFEEENAWLQEWIHEELAHGEVWQRQYEKLLGHQAELCSLLQTKSLKPLEKKTQVLQEELEEAQEILQECQNLSRQRQLQIHKQEKENQRMAETVKELEKKVFKQQLEEKSKKDILKELRMEGNELKRQQQVEKLSSTIQELSLRSQELHRSIILTEDRVMEAQQEGMLFQKEMSSGQGGTSSRGFLWEKQACDQMKRLPCLELSRSDSNERLLSKSVLHQSLGGVWSLLWALAKALLLILLLVLVFYGWFSNQPCPPLHSTPLLYIQLNGLLYPL